MINIVCINCSNIFKAKPSAKRKYCNRECFTEDRLLGDKNHKWKGDEVGYSAIHDWVKIRMGSAFFCAFNDMHVSKSYQWANISGGYKRDLEDWIPLCASCHAKFDFNEKRRDHLKRIMIGRRKPAPRVRTQDEIIRQSATMRKRYAAGLITPWNKGKKGVMPTPWNKGLTFKTI